MSSSTSRCEQRRVNRSPPRSLSPTESCVQPGGYLHCAGRKAARDGSWSSAVKWPPPNLTENNVLESEQAEDLIGHGAARFHGYYERTSYNNHRFYVVVGNELSGDTDQARSSAQVTKYMSATLTGMPNPVHPWRSLEQPSLLSCFGDVPGSITLNYWLGTFGESQPAEELNGILKTREVGLLWLLQRIGRLEFGLEIDVRNHSLLDFKILPLVLTWKQPESHHTALYDKLLFDSREDASCYRTITQQVVDLITVLTYSNWTDFSLITNQVLAVHFGGDDFYRRYQFFEQLVLSIELYLRIHSPEYEETAREHLLLQLPPKVAWDLVVAQRWLENISIGRTESNGGLVTFDLVLRSKRRQVQALRDFAWLLKWPNTGEVEYVLKEKDKNEIPVENRSAEALSWFSGAVLPGYTMPWLIMNALIDCDRGTGDHLDCLSHKYPNSGFQYRANTYWSWQCIVGKVLGAARGVNQVAGWIGPCVYTPELERIQCVQIRQKPPPRPLIRLKDVASMAERSGPLGPPGDNYPVDDYELILPDTDDIVDTVRMEKLSFKAWGVSEDSEAPPIYDCAATFAYAGLSWDIRLRYDVGFISAAHCHSGPHVLFYDYTYRAVKIDKLLQLEGWGSSAAKAETSFSSSEGSSLHCHGALPPPGATDDDDEEDKVLVVEAFGVPDNEVCARAWCSHFGLSAITANIQKTCMACAIREAYAARLVVVILTEGNKDEEVEQVDRRPSRR